MGAVHDLREAWWDEWEGKPRLWALWFLSTTAGMRLAEWLVPSWSLAEGLVPGHRSSLWRHLLARHTQSPEPCKEKGGAVSQDPHFLLDQVLRGRCQPKTVPSRFLVLLLRTNFCMDISFQMNSVVLN